MDKKPTRKELRQRIKELEKEAEKRKKMLQSQQALQTTAENSITEAKRSEQAEEALRESRERFRVLSESSPLGIFQTDAKGSVVYLNRKWLEITGMSMGDALGFGWSEALHPEDRPSALADWVKCLDENIGYDGEFRFVRPSGEITWTHTQTSPVFSTAGEVVSHVGINEDITERKQIEHEFAAEKEFTEKALDAQIDTFFVFDPSTGKAVRWNKAFSEISGYSDEEIQTLKAPDSYYGQEDLEKASIITAKILADGESTVEMSLITKDGRTIPTEYSASALVDAEGRSKYIIAVGRDLRQRIKATEERIGLVDQLQQAQKMEAIGTLSGGIAHDFNNILSIIVGNTELALIDVPEWSPASAHLKEITKASIRARDVVKRILAFSRHTEKHLAPTDIGPITLETLKMLRSTIPTSVEIQEDVVDDLHTINGDATQINQILLNLSTNASHSMKEAGGTLTVTVANTHFDRHSAMDHPGLAPGNHVRLTVSDTGHGIKPEIMEKIFDPYFTTKEIDEGTGMGLAVVHGIVKNHGGAIGVNSKVGEGTAFEVLFPAIDSRPESELASDIDLPKGHERILFVDDEPAITNIYQSMLERLGYTVATRTSSLEALQAFKAQPDEYDLIVTDQTMPHLPGQLLAAELMAIRPDIPIILCTGHSDLIDGDKTREMGIRALVMKPIAMVEIANTIRDVLDKKT